MFFARAEDGQIDAIAALVNSAYRGQSAQAGWTHEGERLAGQRTDPATLRADLAAKPGAMILTLSDAPDGPVVACVWLEPLGGPAWTLGMLTVSPTRQDGQLGRRLLDACEAHVRAEGGQSLKITVIAGRDTLIAWYERRGFQLTGDEEPFPYGDERFGRPLTDDLKFLVMKKRL